MNIFRMYRGLGTPVYVTVSATIINRMGNFVVPFLALFLTLRLGYSEAAAGFTVMAVGSGSFIGALVGGRIADQLGRKQLLTISYVLSAIALATSGFLVDSGNNLSSIIPLLVINEISAGSVRPTLRSILTDLSLPQRRKDAFSLNYLGINVGVALGPLIAGVLFERYLPWLFWGDAISSFIAAALVFRWVPETRPTLDEQVSEDEAFESQPPLKAFFQRPLLVIFTLAMTFQSMVYSQFGFSLPLHINQLFSNGPLKFSQVMSFNALLVLALTPLYTSLTSKFHALIMSAVACLLYVIGFGALALEPGWGLFFSLTAVWTSGEILSVIHQMGYFSQLVPANYRGQFNSYSTVTMSAARVASPAIGGLVIGAFGLPGLWATMAALAAVAALVFLVLKIYEKPLRERRRTASR